MASALHVVVYAAAAVECVAVVATGAYLGLRGGPSPSPPDRCDGPTAHQEDAANCKNQPVVYATRTSRRYHRPTCRYVRTAKTPLKLSRARLHHRPCPRCKPPR